MHFGRKKNICRNFKDDLNHIPVEAQSDILHLRSPLPELPPLIRCTVDICHALKLHSTLEASPKRAAV